MSRVAKLRYQRAGSAPPGSSSKRYTDRFGNSFIDVHHGVHEFGPTASEIMDSSSSSLRAHGDLGALQAGDLAKELIVDSSRGLPDVMLTYEDEEDEVFAAEEEVVVKVASDSGAVDHITNPAGVPRSVVARRPAKVRNFVGAGGDGIKNYGEVNVTLETSEGNTIDSVSQVADVCRPLHSTSKTCDSGHEMLYTKKEGIVVPEGAFSQFLGHLAAQGIKPLARYQREGGLYVATMKVRPAKSDPRRDKEPVFPRPGQSQ